MPTPHEAAGPAPQDALLEVDAHVSRDAYLLEVAGELDRSTAGLLESHLWDADLSGRRRIVVDLAPSPSLTLLGCGSCCVQQAQKGRGIASMSSRPRGLFGG